MPAELKTEQEIFGGGEDSCRAERVDSEGGKARSGAKRAFAGLSWMQLIAPQAVIRAKLTLSRETLKR